MSHFRFFLSNFDSTFLPVQNIYKNYIFICLHKNYNKLINIYFKVFQFHVFSPRDLIVKFLNF